ncbi:hypothetical protein EYF80_041044 [Liparis tanakae]|uniref:Uncharacterized protein n=1 Tax=Liparis tanakae TaxID=230148 RepID=A0A4Z2G6G5_9TELE|nr:hypothetical protein EYF80_041044 [Liparis tanakae]
MSRARSNSSPPLTGSCTDLYTDLYSDLYSDLYTDLYTDLYSDLYTDLYSDLYSDLNAREADRKLSDNNNDNDAHLMLYSCEHRGHTPDAVYKYQESVAFVTSPLPGSFNASLLLPTLRSLVESLDIADLVDLVALDLDQDLVLGPGDGLQGGAGLDAALQGGGHGRRIQTVHVQVLYQSHLQGAQGNHVEPHREGQTGPQKHNVAPEVTRGATNDPQRG